MDKEIDMVDYKRLSFERQVEIVQFYAMSQKYGFCTPFCECGLCGELVEV